MADLAGRRSCVDTDAVLVPIEEPPPLADRLRPPSLVGTFSPARPCTETPRPESGLFDEEVCVHGTLYRFGSREGVFGSSPSLPERVTILSPFRMDRWEVTVARYRAALARGFVSPDATPIANEGPIPTNKTPFRDPTMCSWSVTPQAREAFPLSCVSWETARAFCRFEGGDLPTEAQWEYVAAVEGRPYRTRFAWGGPDDVPPTCARAAWGRGERENAGQLCAPEGFGPLPVDARTSAEGDVTPGLHVATLGGSMAEWARDAFAPFTSRCWASSGVRDPGCFVEGVRDHTLRGGNWRDNIASLIVAGRRSEDEPSSALGFRCVR
jgi:formylglycine-generating enzyme required for sulfatase activity